MPNPFDLINPFMANPLLGEDDGRSVIGAAAEELGLTANREERALQAQLEMQARDNGTTPWAEAIAARKAAGKAQKKALGGSKALKNLEHKFYAREYAALGPQDFAAMWIGTPAHAVLKKAGLRGPGNRETDLREVMAGLEGAAEGGANWLRKQFNLDTIED